MHNTINKLSNRFSFVVRHRNNFSSNLVFGFCFLCSVSFAQGIQSDDSFTLEIGLPNAFVNKPFREIMQGLISVSPYYQYALTNGVAFGIGAHYSYFAVNEFNVPSAIYGGMHCLGGFLKVGHENFWGERFGTDFGLKLGYMHSMIKTDALFEQGIRLNILQSAYIEPNIGLVLSSDEANSYRLTIGYPFFGFGFKPAQIGLEGDAGYAPSQYTRASSFLIVGFGYTHYFNGKTTSEN
jgi:hypothetical protein